MPNRVRILACAAIPVALAAPVTAGPRGFQPSEALCADGTCCSEMGSECIINDKLVQNAYAKLDGGSCTANPGPKN